MTDVLYVAAKAPRPGLVKTRLGATIGHVQAAGLYRAFLADLSARLAASPFAIGWFITPPDAWPELAPLVGGGTRVVAQGEGDWTQRQERLFRSAAVRGERRTILVASDSPQLGLEVVAEAFAQLERHDVVLGEVEDGGYYLLGMRGYHDVLGGIAMSTRSVSTEIAVRAAQRGISVARLTSTFDVDEAKDLQRLIPLALARADLGATRQALREVNAC